MRKSIKTFIIKFFKKCSFLYRYYLSKKLIFAFLMFFFVSCSMTKIFYNYADLLVVNWLESYLELSEIQRSDLNTKVDKFLAWHRESELPKTILFLEELKDRYENGMDKYREYI